jgi:hypothetical protein
MLTTDSIDPSVLVTGPKTLFLPILSKMTNDLIDVSYSPSIIGIDPSIVFWLSVPNYGLNALCLWGYL